MKRTYRCSSRRSVIRNLNRLLDYLPKNKSSRIAIVGIGQELRGDDAAGPTIARALQPILAGHAQFFVIDAGPAPENFTGSLRHFAPHFVLLADAAEMGDSPGSVRCLDWKLATGFSGSTHTLSLSLLAQYLVFELNCTVALLGIQPADNTLGASMTPEVARSVKMVVEAIALLLLSSNSL